MESVSKFLHWEPVTGEPQVVGDRVIRLQARAISLVTPFGGFLGNRPTAVLVEKDGVTAELPIVDVTRYALIGIGVMGVLGMIFVRLASNGWRFVQSTNHQPLSTGDNTRRGAPRMNENS